MSKIMPWIDELPEAAKTDFPARRDEIGALLDEAAELVMTAVIQLTIPDGWANFHLPWAAMAAAIMVMGPGKISLDSVLRKQR